MEVFAAGAGVAPGVGFGSGGDVGNAEGEEGFAEGGGFAGGEDDADGGEAVSEGGDELDEGAVGEGEGFVRSVLVVSGVGFHAGEGDGEGGFPAVFVEVFEVGGKGEGLMAPVGEAEEGSDADAAEPTGVGAFGAVEPPMEFSFRAGGMEALVSFLVVGFLVNDEAFGAVVDEVLVLVVFHGADFDAEGGDEGGESVEAFLEVAFGDEFGVFAGDEEEVAEAFGVEVSGFGDDLINGEGGAEDGVVAREAAVLAVVDAFVGEVKGSEEAHGAAEVTAGGFLALGDLGFEDLIGNGLNHGLEFPEERGGFGQKSGVGGRKTHWEVVTVWVGIVKRGAAYEG